MTNPNELLTPVQFTDGYSSTFQGIMPNGDAAWSSAVTGGLTKREYFASQLMCALISKYQLREPEDQVTTAKMALELTDTLIKELNK
jgi:hypothetical protein